MSDPYLGQIMMAGFSFAQKNFAFCNGQILPIAQNQALFSLLGVKYGGNGTTNFSLPDLRGRGPLAYGQAVGGSNYPIGALGGLENVTLLTSQIPAHNHMVYASIGDGVASSAANAVYAQNTTEQIYATTPGSAMVGMADATVGKAGSNQAHPNMQPYSTINFVIALQGVYPSHS